MGTRKRLALAGLTAAIALALFGATNQAIADSGTHVIYVNGISTFVGQPCQYVWADKDPGTAGIQPDRDTVGIPRPSTLPPTCKTGSSAACALARNLGPYPTNPGNPDLTQGEVGINPPCLVNLSASDLPGEEGCLDPVSGTVDCGINAPTWAYGYCGQTYGGASSGSIKFNGLSWTINRMGFPRGRGVWEFNGKISRGTDNAFIRFYLGAVPDKPEQLAGCDVTLNINSIEFFGSVIINPDQLPRAVSPQAAVPADQHWNYCDTTDGC